jgi:hypothetical protein
LGGVVTYLKESTLTIGLTSRKAVEAGTMDWEREMFKRSSGRIMQLRFESGPDSYRPGISNGYSTLCLSTIPQGQSAVLAEWRRTLASKRLLRRAACRTVSSGTTPSDLRSCRHSMACVRLYV